MKAYKFTIITRPAVIHSGDFFESEEVFICKALIGSDADLAIFSKQLLSFWNECNAIGESHKGWVYELDGDPIKIPTQEISN